MEFLIKKAFLQMIAVIFQVHAKYSNFNGGTMEKKNTILMFNQYKEKLFFEDQEVLLLLLT